MRFLNTILRSSVKDISVVTKDVLKVNVIAGNGGYGLPRFNGIGGNGGAVLFRVNSRLSFTEFCERHCLDHNLRAENGENSQQVKLVGKNGSDLIVEVPYGVECVSDSSLLLARCISLKKPYLIVRGGEGGCAKNNYRSTRGEFFPLYVHLKLRPNVAMLGFPNAGKSTLLKALVPEKLVKISSYPFTTRKPQVCYLKFELRKRTDGSDGEDEAEADSWTSPFTLSLADLPGIIEGASQNRGVGHAFLKHIEYADIVAMVVDVHGFQLAGTLNEPYRNALETIALLNREVDAYSKSLSRKRYVLLLNKIDVNDGDKKAEKIIDLFRGKTQEDRRKWALRVSAELRPRRPIAFEDVLAISARTGELGLLRDVLKSIYNRVHPRKHVVFDEEQRSDNQAILM